MPTGRRRQKEELSAPELYAAKSVCKRKTGLARFSFILAHGTCELYLFLTRINGLSQYTVWKVCPATILRSSVAKIQRNLKMTVFPEMGIE